MKIFKRSVYSLLLLMGLAGTMQAADYGLPAEIQQGNILHCFNWTAQEIKAELPNIAAAGFGSVQMSPLQRPDVAVGSPWHDLYRPYDLAFKSSSYCSEQDLKDLCQAAAQYGIKVIVDIVANHVDKTAGYHDTWWDSNGRVRWEGGIDYGNRNSITHGQLGDYGDVNSENSDVIARGKAYVETLKSLGVKGIRWDAAKHIGLPSEGCGFWSAVTSVPGMWHYGEILDAPGPNASIIKEYANYMSVTDNKYCNYAARDNGGIPGGYGGDWVVNQELPDTKFVYWAESHDTYSNDDWSKDRDQSVIDRAYAAYASRNGATALYLARPNTKGFNNIKVGKGSTAFKNKHVAEVNKFRNIMVGKKDWFESNGNACSITRENGGAVIVAKNSGNVTVTNGGGYCPAGTYTDRVSGGTFTVTASTISGNVGSSGIAVIYNDGINPNPNPDPNPDPNPNPDDELPAINGVYLKNTANWEQPYTWVWVDGGANCNAGGNWPGDKMTKYNDTYWKWELPAGKPDPTSIIFNPGGDNGKTGNLEYVKSAIYDCSGAKIGMANGNPNPDPQKPVVTANPASGTSFSDASINVTLSVSPAATIYYTLDGTAATTSSTRYTEPITVSETTTISTLAVTEAGAQNAQTFKYTKQVHVDPVPGNSLITDYYKVNPNNKVGSNRTVNMKFTKVNNDNRMCVADNALSNWTENDLIAQGVARDVAGALKGKHEYPVVDSYAVYAAYDAQNLYLGVQYVYTVWDIYGDGKLTNGAAKPYNMDGRLMIAFDLDPNKKMSGVLKNGNTIWDADGQYNTFANETDCIWLGSTKSTVGTPGLFFPDENGTTSYDAPYCLALDAPFYGCQDGLLPSIQHIWGQGEFEYDPEVLKGNDGFVDLINEIPADQHTFYEWKFPLSKLGITEDYIKNTGIGVMVIDTYGQGATGSTPYDPTVFDNAKTAYSKDDSSSAEKEDKDVFTYSLARIGKLLDTAVKDIEMEEPADVAPEYYSLQGVRVNNPEHGIYIVRRGNKVTKEVIR